MNDKKTRGLNGLTFLFFVLFLFIALWFTNQFEQKGNEVTWKEFQELVVNETPGEITVVQNKSVPTGYVEVKIKDDEGEEVEKMDALLSLAITGGDCEWL